MLTVGVIVAAVRDWSDGRYSKAGCNLKFLLDWAWARVVHIKDTIDTQTVPLFDHSLAEIDEGGRGVLVSLAGQLAQLVTVISSLSSQGGVITELGADTLDTKLNVTGLVLLYTQVRGYSDHLYNLTTSPLSPGHLLVCQCRTAAGAARGPGQPCPHLWAGAAVQGQEEAAGAVQWCLRSPLSPGGHTL